MDITYGMDIKSHENQYLQAAERAMQFMERALVPGAFLVDAIPIRASINELFPILCLAYHPPILKVKYVPEWFPGAGFQTFAREARGHFDLAVDGPLAYVKRSLEVGHHLRSRLYFLSVGADFRGDKSESSSASIVSTGLARVAELADQGFDESIVRNVASSMYIGESPPFCIKADADAS